MIESVELVVAALTAGAAAGVTETASTAVQDSYQGLKARVLSVLRERGSASGEVVERVQADAVDGTEHQLELAAALQEADARVDSEMVAAAQHMLELVDPDGMASGKYRMVVHGNKGVQIGDHNTQTNTFN